MDRAAARSFFYKTCRRKTCAPRASAAPSSAPSFDDRCPVLRELGFFGAMLQLRSTQELTARLEAERAGAPFLLFRDGEDRQQIVRLPDQRGEVVVGREPDVDVPL